MRYLSLFLIASTTSVLAQVPPDISPGGRAGAPSGIIELRKRMIEQQRQLYSDQRREEVDKERKEKADQEKETPR